MAVRTKNLPLHTLEDLLTKNTRLMMPAGGNIQASFPSAPLDSLVGQLWAKNVLPYKDKTLVPFKERGAEEALEFVMENDNYAYVSVSFPVMHHSLYPCGVTNMEEIIWSVQNSIGYQKNSPLTELFNYKLSQMMTRGMVAKLSAK